MGKLFDCTTIETSREITTSQASHIISCLPNTIYMNFIKSKHACSLRERSVGRREAENSIQPKQNTNLLWDVLIINYIAVFISFAVVQHDICLIKLFVSSSRLGLICKYKNRGKRANGNIETIRK
jgi:hypothetical protein